MPIRFGRVMQPAGVPGSGAANGRRGSNWRKLGSPTFAPMAVRRLSAIASRNDATADRNAFSSYGWQATNPINNFRAHGGVPWTEGTRGRGAGEHRRARCRVRQGHQRGTIVQRSALLGDSPLTHRIRFLLEMPIANLFDFLL